MKQRLKILLLEDNPADAELIERLVKKTKSNCEFHHAIDKENFLDALEKFYPDVILSDNSLPQFNATEALQIIRQRSMQVPFILVTGTVSEEFAATIMKLGADDYILKDRMARLPAAIDTALKQKWLEKEKQEAADKLIQSEEKYRTIFLKSPLPKWLYDPKTLRFLEVNEEAIRHYGYSQEEFLSMTIKDIRPKEDIELLLKDIKEIYSRPDAQKGIWKHQKKNGEVIIVETTAHSVNYNNRKVRMVVANDITKKIVAEEELSRNELRFRILTSNAPVGIFQTDAAGKTIYVNETWMKYTGLTFDEAMGDGWRKALHPDDKAKQLEQWQVRSQSGLESSSEFRLIDKTGNIKWVIGKATPVFDKNHQMTGYIGTLSDITENKKAEEKLQKSEEQYRDLVENITDLICTHDLDGRVLSVNSAAEKLLGRKFNPLDNLNIKHILAPDKKNEFDLYIAELKKAGRVQGLMKVKTFLGKIHIWEYNNSLKTEGVNTPIVRGYARDITESIKAEKELRASEMKLKEAQAIAHISNWEIDMTQNVHEWSDEFYRIFGYQKGEIHPSAKTFLSFMHPDDAAFAQNKVQEAFDTLKDSSFNFRFIRKDGIIRHGYTEWKFEFDKKGKPLRLYGILQDITERKEAEEELKKSNERFKYAAKATLDIIWELNFETKEYLVHEGAEKLFGEKKDINWKVGVEGKYIVEEDQERVRESFRKARVNPDCELWREEYSVWGVEKNILNIVNHAIFIRDKKGNVTRAIGAITDLTDKKKLETKLLEQQKNEQLKITSMALDAQEKERNAIGQELHDNVNQILVGTKLLLSIAKNKPAEYLETIIASIDNLQSAIDENRKIAHELVTPDLLTKKFNEQIENLSDAMLKTSGINVELNTNDLKEELLSDKQKLAIYRIAQEQCTNIIKYAQATSVDILLKTSNDEFMMIIIDNGIGMDPAQNTTGIGLRNINARLSVFHGTVNIETNPGNGFKLEIKIPLIS